MRVLIGIDGSEQSYEAVGALGHLSPAEEVILVHALDIAKPAFPIRNPQVASDLSTALERNGRAEGERILTQAASLLPRPTGTITKRLEVGKPTDVILSVAEEKGVHFILLGGRGLSPTTELFLGSVSHRVLSHAHCPVLVVRNPLRRLERILLALEGSEDAKAAVRFLASKPFRKPVDLVILTGVSFVQPPWPADATVSEKMKGEILEAARYFVEDVASRLAPDLYRARGYGVLGSPCGVILEEAMKSSPDLILLGSRGRHGLTRFVLGSVCHAVLHQAPCPVLVFPWPGV